MQALIEHYRAEVEHYRVLASESGRFGVQALLNQQHAARLIVRILSKRGWSQANIVSELLWQASVQQGERLAAFYRAAAHRVERAGKQ